MIIVTGGAGFIGSCLVAQFNRDGRDDLLIADHIAGFPEKKENLHGKRYAEYLEKDVFLSRLLADDLPDGIETVVHMGACSSTTGDDPDYYEQNNYEYSRYVAEWALQHRCRLIYASSAATYGDGSQGYDDDESQIGGLRPLNYYGQSKQKFDRWIVDNGLAGQVVGLKFFNVFGPNEYHKGDMRSVIAKAYDKAVREGVIRLFKSYHPDYADGEQRRDFIYVKDVVDVVMFFCRHPQVNGIFNVGTGASRTWNDVARALFSAIGRKPAIEYIDMPEYIRPRYQYFTEAKMDKLRRAGYSRPFTSLEDAVADYAAYLATGKRM